MSYNCSAILVALSTWAIFAHKPNMAARRLVRAIFEISPFRK
jgi:hypothetical protein